MEFRTDGTMVRYEDSCEPLPALTYFLNYGDIYVSTTIPGKGPVAIIFHPNSVHTQLTLTSYRTRKNAVFERKDGGHCGGHG